jgi:hypothetical protein
MSVSRDEANVLFQKGDFAGALAVYKSILAATEPDLARAVTPAAAAALLGRLSPTRAEEACKLFNNMSASQLKLSDVPGAVLSASVAQALGPRNAKALFRLGQAQEAAGCLVAAAEAYKRALALEPTSQVLRDAYQRLRLAFPSTLGDALAALEAPGAPLPALLDAMLGFVKRDGTGGAIRAFLADNGLAKLVECMKRGVSEGLPAVFSQCKEVLVQSCARVAREDWGAAWASSGSPLSLHPEQRAILGALCEPLCSAALREPLLRLLSNDFVGVTSMPLLAALKVAERFMSQNAEKALNDWGVIKAQGHAEVIPLPEPLLEAARVWVAQAVGALAAVADGARDPSAAADALFGMRCLVERGKLGGVAVLTEKVALGRLGSASALGAAVMVASACFSDAPLRKGGGEDVSERVQFSLGSLFTVACRTLSETYPRGHPYMGTKAVEDTLLPLLAPLVARLGAWLPFSSAAGGGGAPAPPAGAPPRAGDDTASLGAAALLLKAALLAARAAALTLMSDKCAGLTPAVFFLAHAAHGPRAQALAAEVISELCNDEVGRGMVVSAAQRHEGARGAPPLSMDAALKALIDSPSPAVRQAAAPILPKLTGAVFAGAPPSVARGSSGAPAARLVSQGGGGGGGGRAPEAEEAAEASFTRNTRDAVLEGAVNALRLAVGVAPMGEEAWEVEEEEDLSGGDEGGAPAPLKGGFSRLVTALRKSGGAGGASSLAAVDHALESVALIGIHTATKRALLRPGGVGVLLVAGARLVAALEAVVALEAEGAPPPPPPPPPPAAPALTPSASPVPLRKAAHSLAWVLFHLVVSKQAQQDEKVREERGVDPADFRAMEALAMPQGALGVAAEEKDSDEAVAARVTQLLRKGTVGGDAEGMEGDALQLGGALARAVLRGGAGAGEGPRPPPPPPPAAGGRMERAPEADYAARGGATRALLSKFFQAVATREWAHPLLLRGLPALVDLATDHGEAVASAESGGGVPLRMPTSTAYVTHGARGVTVTPSNTRVGLSAAGEALARVLYNQNIALLPATALGTAVSPLVALAKSPAPSPISLLFSGLALTQLASLAPALRAEMLRRKALSAADVIVCNENHRIRGTGVQLACNLACTAEGARYVTRTDRLPLFLAETMGLKGAEDYDLTTARDAAGAVATAANVLFGDTAHDDLAGGEAGDNGDERGAPLSGDARASAVAAWVAAGATRAMAALLLPCCRVKGGDGDTPLEHQCSFAHRGATICAYLASTPLGAAALLTPLRVIDPEKGEVKEEEEEEDSGANNATVLLLLLLLARESSSASDFPELAKVAGLAQKALRLVLTAVEAEGGAAMKAAVRDFNDAQKGKRATGQLDPFDIDVAIIKTQKWFT